MKDKKIQLLLALVAITALSGAIYFKEVYPNTLHPVASKADEPQAHWPHSTTPFSLPLLNSTSSATGSRDMVARGFWDKTLQNATNSWSKAGVMNFSIKPGNKADPCYMYPEMINFCSENRPDDFMIYGTYSYWANTGHITTAVFMVNDYYLNNKESGYSTPEWRNYLLCQEIGFTLGANYRYKEPDNSTTCMDAMWKPDNVQNQQSPDNQDLSNLKSAYDHIDDTSSSAAAYKVGVANKAFTAKDFGTLTSSAQDGKVLTYTKNLGDGSIMKTIVIKPGILKQSKPATPATTSR